MSRDPRIDAYIATAAPFAVPVLTWLRDRVHAACPDVDETIKWGRPFFTRRGRPLANMSAFGAHASFGFWNRADLATGHEGEAMGQYGRIETLADLPDAAHIEANVRAAVALIDNGVPKRPARPAKPEAEVPPELANALATDTAAMAIFNGFPPSGRREYCEWVAEAKRPETRDRRIVETIAMLREGKRRNWKYESC